MDGQVMSRAISLYMDRVTQSLGALQELEKEAKHLDERQQATSPTVPADEGTDGPPSTERQGSHCVSYFVFS